MRVLMDTNILIYSWDAGDKFKQSRSISLLEQARGSACITVQSLSEFSSVMLKKGCSPEWVQRVVSTYIQFMTVLPLAPLDIANALRAVRQYRMSYWDAQLWAVACAHNIPEILTEDGPIGQEIEGVFYRNPLE